MPLTTGFVLINRYRVVSLLGQGGFGAVYRATGAQISAGEPYKQADLPRQPGMPGQLEQPGEQVQIPDQPAEKR